MSTARKDLPAPAANAPTMHDVAKLAGVSHQTVSRVLNGNRSVSERTRRLVETAISQLGYRPNRAAQFLATGASRAVGVVLRSDHEAGAHAATRYLLEAGHATVWHVSGPGDWFDARARVAGWHRALAEAGAEVPPLLPADWHAASGYRSGQVLARMPDVTAIFAASDRLAQGILRAMREAGRRVPEDVSVVGFDDVPEAAHCIPPLTTVRPDFGAVAGASLDLLLAQITSGRRLCERRVLVPVLVPRESVAPLRC